MGSQEKQTVEISVALINEVLTYLAAQPYGSVYVLIHKIQKEAAESMNVVKD